MRLLVTGTAGFVGTAAVEVLGREHWLRCVDIAPTPEPANGESLVADLVSYAAAVAAVEDIEAVVHLAAVAGAAELFETPELPMKSTVVATANLLEAARRAGIRRFVLMSSGAVITGYSRETYIHVGLPHKFQGLYCLTKSLQENIAEQYAEEHGMTIPSLRPWSVVDGRTYRHRDGQPLDPGAPYYFGLVCRYDLAEACRLALTAPLEGFQPFHIMATAEGRRWFDVDHTERLLGWRPTVDFADLARRTENP
ncbi:MAG: uronate dehydrogenase [Thermomicrobiales bacterium]|jgi:nucleoside-diphosphate-sugar epimerase|nr:uronate dehydrogenase [Thermomicrobiales bacterium]